MRELEHVLWIGGGTGAGKTSIATRLARDHAVQTYHYDWHDARDHSERMQTTRHTAMATWAAMSPDERWVNRTPEQMAQLSIADAHERMEMVIEDLRARPTDEPIVAEGYGFYPDLVAHLLPDARHAIWLLPTPTFRESALAARGWSAPGGTTDQTRARSNRLARDELLTNHVRSSAAARGLTTIEVSQDTPLDAVLDQVERHFAPTLDDLRTRRPLNDDLHDAELRANIRGGFAPFLSACTRGHSVLERAAARHGLESHVLGLLHSAYLAAGRSRVTEVMLRTATPAAGRSRVGPEYWAPLVRAAFALEDDGGWRVTEHGVQALRELYAELREEIRRRTVSPALAGRVGEYLERMSYMVPLWPRARFIRDLWGEEEAVTLVRLYRAVWELWVLPDPDAYTDVWPRGVGLEALNLDFAQLTSDVLR